MWDSKEKHEQHKPIQRLRACLAMCLKFEKFEALCAYKPRAYKKKSVLYKNTHRAKKMSSLAG